MRVPRLLALLISALLVGDVVGVATVGNGGSSVATSSSTSTIAVTTSSSVLVSPTSIVTSTPTTAPDPLAQTVKQLEAFVEQHRGLKYKRPVKVELLTNSEFRTRLLALAQDDNDELVICLSIDSGTYKPKRKRGEAAAELLSAMFQTRVVLISRQEG